MPLAARLRPLAALLVIAAGAACASAPAADAATVRCKARAGTVYKDTYTRIWHERKTLYACTAATASGLARTARLGPWRAGSRAQTNGSHVVWTTPHSGGDRLWAGSISGRRWLSGARAVPASASGPAREGRVQRLLTTDFGAGWITTTSDAVLAIFGAGIYEPIAIGALPAPLQASGPSLLVGSFPSVPAADLASTARITGENGEVDDCGGSRHYTLTVIPSPAAPPVGARWDGTAPIDPSVCNVGG